MPHPRMSHTALARQVENIPGHLRSAPALYKFFAKLFPGEVYNVEIALDLSELNALTAQRQSVRDALEKAIAAYEATNVRPQVYIQTGKVTMFPDGTQVLMLLPPTQARRQRAHTAFSTPRRCVVRRWRRRATRWRRGCSATWRRRCTASSCWTPSPTTRTACRCTRPPGPGPGSVMMVAAHTLFSLLPCPPCCRRSTKRWTSCST